MLKLGRAQGVAMAAALMKDLPILEYSPRKVKQAITGNGSSSKEQVAAMIQSILKLKNITQRTRCDRWNCRCNLSSLSIPV